MMLFATLNTDGWTYLGLATYLRQLGFTHLTLGIYQSPLPNIHDSGLTRTMVDSIAFKFIGENDLDALSSRLCQPHAFPSPGTYRSTISLMPSCIFVPASLISLQLLMNTQHINAAVIAHPQAQWFHPLKICSTIERVLNTGPEHHHTLVYRVEY